MSTDVIPLKPMNYLAKKGDALAKAFNAGLAGGIPTGGFPSIKYRSSRWRVIVRGEETVLDSLSIDVVLVTANPGLSKSYFKSQYEQGDDKAPDCSSADAITPDAFIKEPVSESCISCPMNVFGSRISETGKKSKACADRKRIAVLPADQLDGDLYLLDLAPTHLKELRSYIAKLDQHGVPANAVRTRLSFDSEASYPLILFNVAPEQPQLTEAEYEQVLERLDDPVLVEMLGVLPGDPEQASAKEPAKAPSTPPKKAASAPRPAPEKAPEAPPAEAKKAPNAKVSGFGAKAAAEVVEAAPVKKVATVVESSDFDAEIDDILNELEEEDD